MTLFALRGDMDPRYSSVLYLTLIAGTVSAYMINSASPLLALSAYSLPFRLLFYISPPIVAVLFVIETSNGYFKLPGHIIYTDMTCVGLAAVLYSVMIACMVFLCLPVLLIRVMHHNVAPVIAADPRLGSFHEWLVQTRPKTEQAVAAYMNTVGHLAKPFDVLKQYMIRKYYPLKVHVSHGPPDDYFAILLVKLVDELACEDVAGFIAQRNFNSQTSTRQPAAQSSDFKLNVADYDYDFTDDESASTATNTAYNTDPEHDYDYDYDYDYNDDYDDDTFTYVSGGSIHEQQFSQGTVRR